MSYAYGVGVAAKLATQRLSRDLGADKVGFTAVRQGRRRPAAIHRRRRGLIERNTMRYYMAIESFAAFPAPEQLDKRLGDWFDATERFPRQLHELEREAYITMKREEVGADMPGDPTPAAMEFAAPDTWNLSGHWTALGIGDLVTRLRDPDAARATHPAPAGPSSTARASRHWTASAPC